jgi:hypothetical protein
MHVDPRLIIAVYLIGFCYLGIRSAVAWTRFSRLYHLQHLPDDLPQKKREQLAHVYSLASGPLVWTPGLQDSPDVAAALKVFVARLILHLAFALGGFALIFLLIVTGVFR